jgi:hypothetical protein
VTQAEQRKTQCIMMLKSPGGNEDYEIGGKEYSHRFTALLQKK